MVRQLRFTALLALVVMISACGGSPTAPSPNGSNPPPVTLTQVSLGPTPASGTVASYGYNLATTLHYQVSDADMPLGSNAWVAACISLDGVQCLSGAGTLKKVSDRVGSVDLMIGLPSTFTHDNPFGGIITQTKYVLSFLSKDGDPFTGGTKLATEVAEREIRYQ